MCYYSVVAASAVVEVAFVAAVTVAVAIDTAFVAAPYSFDVVCFKRRGVEDVAPYGKRKISATFLRFSLCINF